MKQDSLLLVDAAVPRVHAGPCIEALRDEVDATDPADVTCPQCLERRARVRPLTFAQRRRLEGPAVTYRRTGLSGRVAQIFLDGVYMGTVIQ